MAATAFSQARLLISTLVAIVIAIAATGAVPSAPSNLAAQVVGSTVTLTWTPSFLGPVIGYRLEAGSASGLSDLATTIVGVTPSLTAIAVPNGTYFVRVRAVGVDGESAPSNEVIITVPGGGGCSTPPASPLNLASGVNGLIVTLSWLPGGGCPASNFILHAGSAPGLSNIAVVNVGAALGLTASAPPGTYYIRVYAQNAFGASGPSNEVAVHVTPPAGGIVVVSSDDWVLSDTAFARLPRDTANLTVNLARFLGGRTGRIHAYSDFFALTDAQLAATLRNAGFTFTAGVGINFDLPTLSAFDAVFMGLPLPTPSQLAVLDQYVARGGNVYLHGGNFASTPNLVPNAWNPFLLRFGLALATGFDGLRGNIPLNSSYPLFSGVSAVYNDGGHPITGCCVVARTTSGRSLFAVSQGGRIP